MAFKFFVIDRNTGEVHGTNSDPAALSLAGNDYLTVICPGTNIVLQNNAGDQLAIRQQTLVIEDPAS